MKRLCTAIFLVLLLSLAIIPAGAADIQIKVDGVIIDDVPPDIINNRVMVPVHVISENLGAKVSWSDAEITLTEGTVEVTLDINNGTAVKNGEAVSLSAKPYIKDGRTMVPLRFLAEALGCQVNYEGFTVTVNTEPLLIDGVKVNVVQLEYHMTMGGIIQHIKGSGYNRAIYNVFAENKGSEIDPPAYYSWRLNLDTPGAYYKNGQYDFLTPEGNSIQQFDIYTLIESFPPELLAEYPPVVLHDATADRWYLFSDTAIQSINQLIDNASENGFLEVISNTVV